MKRFVLKGQRLKESTRRDNLLLQQPKDLGARRGGRKVAKLMGERACRYHACLLLPSSKRSAQQVHSMEIQLGVFISGLDFFLAFINSRG